MLFAAFVSKDHQGMNSVVTNVSRTLLTLTRFSTFYPALMPSSMMQRNHLKPKERGRGKTCALGALRYATLQLTGVNFSATATSAGCAVKMMKAFYVKFT